MPNITLPDGRRHYIKSFSLLCDRCERRVPSDWIEERCEYECDDCQRDIRFEEEMAAECEDWPTDEAAE